MADLGYHTQLYVGTNLAATTATVLIAAITGVTPPGLTVDEVETTNMDQTTLVRTFMPGLIDPGSASMELQWTPSSTTDDLLRTILTGREARFWEIQFNGLAVPIKFGGRGFLTEYTPGAAKADGEMTATITIRASAGIWIETT